MLRARCSGKLNYNAWEVYANFERIPFLGSHEAVG